MKFDELGLSPEVMKAVADMGYTDLTPIQEQTYSLIREGKDLMAMAETGSGKTSACGIPISDMVDPDIPGIQALILVPTRELALQYVDTGKTYRSPLQQHTHPGKSKNCCSGRS